NFSLPFVILSSFSRFSKDAFSSKVNNPSSHKIQPQDDGRLGSEVVSRILRNPVALRPQRTHTAGRASGRQRSARVNFTSVTIELTSPLNLLLGVGPRALRAPLATPCSSAGSVRSTADQGPALSGPPPPRRPAGATSRAARAEPGPTPGPSRCARTRPGPHATGRRQPAGPRRDGRSGPHPAASSPSQFHG